MNINDKPVLVANLARTGQGWLSFMLCYILNAKFVEPYCLLRGIVYSADPYIVEKTSGNLPSRKQTQYSLIVKTHQLPDPFFSLTDKVILLSRDPRDVAVSAYARYSTVQKTGTDLIAQDQGASIARTQRRYYLQQVKEWLWSRKLVCFFLIACRWKKFYEGWGDITICLRVTYEELSKDPKTVLLRILKYLEVEADEGLVDDAIRKFSFEALSGRKKGVEDKGNTSFRKGIVGDYKNHFNPFYQYMFDVICGKAARQWGFMGRGE